MAIHVNVWGIPYNLEDIDDQIKILKIAKDHYVHPSILKFIERSNSESAGSAFVGVGEHEGTSKSFGSIWFSPKGS